MNIFIFISSILVFIIVLLYIVMDIIKFNKEIKEEDERFKKQLRDLSNKK